MLVGEVHADIEQGCDCHIHGYRLERIVDGILLLAHKIRQHHSRAIACHSAPCTSHIAVLRHEQHIDSHKHHASGGREPSSVDGLVDELIPEREVEVYAHHYLGSHHYWHHSESGPVALVGDDESQDVEIGYHHEERQQGEDNEILHSLGIGVAVVFVLRLAEDERLVGIAERLGYHSHNHGNLGGGSIDAELRLLVNALVEVGEDYLVESLVKDARNSEHKQRPCVAEHASPQLAVETPAETRELAPEAEQHHTRAYEIDVEHHTHVHREMLVVESEWIELHGWQHDEIHEVEHDVEHDIDQLQRGKLNSLLLIAQIGERDALEGVDRHTHEHHSHPTLMVGIFHERGYLRQEGKYECHEQGCRGAYRYEHGGVDGLRILVGLVDVAEEGGLHAIGQDYEQERRIGVDICNDTILSAARGKCCRLNRHQQIIDETARDAAKTVDGSIFCQTLQISHCFFFLLLFLLVYAKNM